MARIFNIYFTYDDEMYNAIVSVHSNPFFTEYILGNLDADLRMLLPGSKVISQSPGEFFFQNILSHHSPELMKAIIQSITHHLRASNNVSSDMPTE